MAYEVPQPAEMATNSTYARETVDRDTRGAANDYVRAINQAQRMIPPGNVNGTIAYNIDTKPIKAGLRLQKEFWSTDFQVFENAAQAMMGKPLRDAKLQIATQFSGVASAFLNSAQ